MFLHRFVCWNVPLGMIESPFWYIYTFCAVPIEKSTPYIIFAVCCYTEKADEESQVLEEADVC